MKEREQIVHFERELERLIQRFRMEYRLSVASAIGVLQLQIHKICVATVIEEDDDERSHA